LVTDQVGSLRLVVDSTGNVVEHIDYQDFGDMILDTAPGLTPFGFASGLHDADTNLVRFGWRDYDAQIGRWLGADPVRFEAKDSNLYRYVNSDPVNAVDPSGTAVPIVIASCAANPWCVLTVATAATAIVETVNICMATWSKKKKCSDQYDIDIATCNGVSGIRGPVAGGRCWKSAAERLAACNAGRPIPPLDVWNN